MSGIKRGIKKVFRGVKKVIKKIAKPALIIGGTLLTAGLVTGGFAAFKGVTTLGGFLKATGQTILAGGQSIAGSLNIGGGISPELAGGAFAEAGYGGATLGSGVLAQSLGLPGPGIGLSQVPEGAGVLKTQYAPDFPTGFKGRAPGGLFRKVAGAFGGLSDMGQYAVINGIMGGIGGMMEERELRRQERRQDELGVFGMPRRGEGGYTPEQIAEMFEPYRLKSPQEFLSPYESQLPEREERTTPPPMEMPAPRQPLLG